MKGMNIFIRDELPQLIGAAGVVSVNKSSLAQIGNDVLRHLTIEPTITATDDRSSSTLMNLGDEITFFTLVCLKASNDTDHNALYNQALSRTGKAKPVLDTLTSLLIKGAKTSSPSAKKEIAIEIQNVWKQFSKSCTTSTQRFVDDEFKEYWMSKKGIYF